MVYLFEKKPKIFRSDYGIEGITDKDVFKKGPAMIVILAQTWFLSSINGAIKLISGLVNPRVNDKYDPNRRLFGLGFGSCSCGGYDGTDMEFSEFYPEEQELVEFVDYYFLPLVSNNNSKIDLMTAMKNIRNINFVTYCDGAKTYKKIEDILASKMKEIGYLDKEIDLILSQISLAAVSSKIIEGGTRATSLLFNDRNDSSINDCLESSDLLIKQNGCYRFVINGDGDHDFRKYVRGDANLSTAIKLFLKKALNNSIYNNNSDSFVPLSQDLLISDTINSYNKSQESEVEYRTYAFNNYGNVVGDVSSAYRNYEKTNFRMSIDDFTKDFGLLPSTGEDNDRLIEVAIKGDEVVGFCLHELNYRDKYEIRFLVCSGAYRKNGIATKLITNAFINMSKRGYDNCILETSPQLESYQFWINKGASLVNTTYVGLFDDVPISVLQFSNIRQYLNSSNTELTRKKTLN